MCEDHNYNPAARSVAFTAYDHENDDPTFNQPSNEHKPSAARLPHNKMHSLTIAPMLQASVELPPSKLLPTMRDAKDTQELVVASTAATLISKVDILSLLNELLSSIAEQLCGSQNVLTSVCGPLRKMSCSASFASHEGAYRRFWTCWEPTLTQYRKSVTLTSGDVMKATRTAVSAYL